MAHVVYQAKFSSRLPPFERVYVGSTDRPDLRPEQLADRSLGKQPKFLKQLVGSVQFEILHVKLTQPSAWLLEAKVAADLFVRYRSLCVRGAGWSKLSLTKRHLSELEAVHSSTSLQQILALDYARDGGPLSQHLRGLSFKPPAGTRPRPLAPSEFRCIVKSRSGTSGRGTRSGVSGVTGHEHRQKRGWKPKIKI